MKKLARFCTLIAGICWLAVSPARAEDHGAMVDHLSGTYVVIGKHAGSGILFDGAVKLTRSGYRLQVVRTIAGQATTGTGTLEKALRGETTVLRVRFVHAGQDYEATYLIDGDLDNYARLTGYVYLKDGSTKRVGLEALFADFGQLQRQ